MSSFVRNSLFFGLCLGIWLVSCSAQAQLVSFPQVITLPQIVAGGGFTTRIVATMELADAICDVEVLYHNGAGQAPSVPLTINGAEYVSPFFHTFIPPAGQEIWEIGAPSGQFIGAATVFVADFCAGSVDVQVQYKLEDNQGQLQELFSYPSLRPVPMGACASAPVQYSPNSAEVNIPGLATVSVSPLVGVERCMELRRASGDVSSGPLCEPYNGRHDSRLLSDFFPNENPLNGTWRVCFQQNPAGSAAPAGGTFETRPSVGVLFLNVLSKQDRFQLASNEHSVRSPSCRRSFSVFCVNDARFELRASLPDQSGSFGLASAEITRDETAFFWLDESLREERLGVKVINGCSVNRHFWVVRSSTSDIEYTLQVRDTQTGTTRTYRSQSGSFLDDQAFDACP